ncbi:MAG: zf-TFIIB domain-containing protein [Dehalococcoidia bacterium]|nr:zf-TFIIB domain-containing protein [Dehalococcoidia bacterium]
MLCPNDNSEMGQVKVVSHYGGPIFVDQCERCGGIWFDESELFRAKQGEAEKIEALNTEMLRTPSAIENSTLSCPRDQGPMQRFTDRYFPQDIVLVRCQLCHGLWLNRGIFTKYQQFRQELMRPEKSTEDEKMKAQWEASYKDGRSTGTRGRLVEFLSTPIEMHEHSVYPSGVGSIVDDIADFLATTITNLLMPGWKC